MRSSSEMLTTSWFLPCSCLDHSVGSRKRNLTSRRAAADEAAGPLDPGVRVEVAGRDAARLLLDPGLAFRALTPRRPHEAGAVAEVLDELGKRGDLVRVAVAEVARPLEQRVLEVDELVADGLVQADGRDRALLPRQSVHHRHLARLDVARPDLQPERHALQLPAVELLARPLVCPVDPQPDALGLDVAPPGLDELVDQLPAGGVPEDRHDDHLD